MKSSHVIRRFAQHQTTTQNNTWVPTFSETSHTSCFIRMCGTVKTSTSSGQRTWKSAILKPSVNRRSLCLVGIYRETFRALCSSIFNIFFYFFIFFIQCINQELGHYSCWHYLGDKRLWLLLWLFYHYYQIIIKNTAVSNGRNDVLSLSLFSTRQLVSPEIWLPFHTVFWTKKIHSLDSLSTSPRGVITSPLRGQNKGAIFEEQRK